jgi:hypothetical protein
MDLEMATEHFPSSSCTPASLSALSVPLYVWKFMMELPFSGKSPAPVVGLRRLENMERFSSLRFNTGSLGTNNCQVSYALASGITPLLSLFRASG